MKEKKKSQPKAEFWQPICRFNAYDFNEATGRYLDSSSLVELQQEATTKAVRCVVVR